MKFSILIPFYNSAKFLEKCLDSCVNQTFTDFEIICLNDGGDKDNSLEIIKSYQKKDSRIFIYENDKNYGLSFCRNKLISLAKGEYFFFLDSDDWIHLKTLEWINKKIVENNNIDIVSAKSYFCYKFNKFFIKIPFFPTAYRFKMNKFHFVKANICTPWGHAIRLDFWKKIGSPKFLVNKSFEDIGLMPYIFLKSTSFTFLNKKIYFYFKRKKTLSSFSSFPYEKALDILDELTNLITLLYNDNMLNNKKNKKAINGTYIIAIVAVIFFMWKIKDKQNKKIIKERIVQLLISKKIVVDFSKTWWKSIAFFIIAITLFFSFTEIKLKNKKEIKIVKSIYTIKKYVKR